MKNIAIIIGNFSRGNGTERAVTNLANSLCAYGEYSVEIISCETNDGTVPYFEIDKSIKIHNLALSLAKKSNYLRIARQISAICKKEKTDFLLGTTHALNSIMTLVHLANLKKIACEHMNYAAAPFYSRIARRFAYPKLDAVVLLTNADRAHYSFCRNTFVIPNCIPIHKESSDCKNKIMLAVGRYTYQKGFDMLIDAFNIAHSECPDWKLRIVGGGKDEGLLKAKITGYKLENSVDLVPFTKNIQAEYLNAGLYVLSSRFEGFVLVLIEAKDAGLPTVAFNCPEGPADIVCDGKDGFLVEPNNVSDFAKRMVELANNEMLRKQFGAYGKEDVKRLSPESVFKMWDKLFGEV